MRVAIAIDCLNGGGAPKVMISLAAELVKLEHEPHFLLLDRKNIFEVDNVITVNSSAAKNFEGMCKKTIYAKDHYCFSFPKKLSEGVSKTVIK
ncbi:hypothetical protein AB4345_04240 [Vibrio breoganii]|uniref:hypothetical protein n=1 Tax=Vibrio breoganii TaxID=553239 RepID=UPI000C848D93|nr:hypothetical protein [Vibrio breoganii]PML34558.1 hypothetical protein BCT78_13685 [Vibrio breoganii]